jgi:hypothetical protein
LRTLDVLDRRRHHVVEVSETIERTAVPVGAIGGVVALAGTIAYIVHRVVVKRRAQRTLFAKAARAIKKIAARLEGSLA